MLKTLIKRQRKSFYINGLWIFTAHFFVSHNINFIRVSAYKVHNLFAAKYHHFGGNSANNYGFGMTNIENNINNVLNPLTNNLNNGVQYSQNNLPSVANDVTHNPNYI